MRRTWPLGMIVVAACGGGTDYFDMPPEEAAAELADKGCDAVFACGVIELDCLSTPPSVTVSPPEAYYPTEQACLAELEPLYLGILAGCELAALTDDERADINDCYGASASCLSDAELEEFATVVCGGGFYGTEACDRARDAWRRCGDCAEDPASCGGS